MRVRFTGLLAAGAALTGATSVVAADELRFSAATETDLAAALAPLHDEGAGGGAERPAPREHGGGGLRCWLGMDARERDPFDDFARPVTNLAFHHPFLWNEIRPVFVQHWFPEDSITEGGNLRAYALQVNAKITDDVMITAYKDGYTDFNPDANLPKDEGWNDVAAGVKVKLWEDVAAPAIFTVGLGYETGWGDEEVLQGGDGDADIVDVFGSYARRLGPLNFIGTAGLLVPVHHDEAVTTLHWHAHLDLPVTAHVNALLEVNAFHYLDDAENNAGLGPSVPLGFEGFDYTNLGSDDVSGNSVATVGLGFRWFMTDDVSLGAAFEWPITDREDVIDKRFTMDMVFRF